MEILAYYCFASVTRFPTYRIHGINLEFYSIYAILSGRTLIEILWSDLTFKQYSSWIYRSAGTPVLLLSSLVYSEVALECLQGGKSGNFVA